MKRTLLFLLLFLLAVPLGAQMDYHRRIPPMPYARIDRNQLQFPGGDAPTFETFLRKLDTLLLTGQGDVRILHIGDSHIQAGTWTNTFRKNLLSLRYGIDGGRGFVFPFAAAGTHTPMGYQSSYTGTWSSSRCLRPETVMGLSGMTVSTVDTATVTLDLAPSDRGLWDTRYMFRSVDVLGYGDLEPVVLLDREKIHGRLQDERWHFELPYFTDRVQIGFESFPGKYTIKGVYLDRPEEGLTVSEVGVNGAQTSSFLKCEDFTRDLKMVKPDLVIFSLGINDLQGSSFEARRFVTNFSKLVQLVRHANPDCAFLFTTCSDTRKNGRTNPFGAQARDTFKEIAAGSGAALWDLFEIMGGEGSMEAWVRNGLASQDYIHFTQAGYTVLGDLLFNALMDSYYRFSAASTALK
ncbi:MAG: hypothetical protein IJP49_09720 [Bacteroidales bacterium]|nr:hypothetical protein [Bacteroidales bacterium]